MIIPEKIRKGDAVGFISPSAGLAPLAMHRIKKAREAIESLGYRVKLAENSLKNKGYVSTTIEDRVSDIHEMFADPEVKMIMCTIGGNHSNQIIKYLNYNLIKKNPKIFVGYSDITVLHFALQSQANLATYYGPCAMTQFGENPKVFDYTVKYFNYQISKKYAKKNYKVRASSTWTEEVLNWFNKDDLKRPRKMKVNTGYKWLIPGKAKGALWGGSIPSINHLAGTKYWLNPKNKIFFLDIPEGETVGKGLNIANVDSFLADLDNLGVFNVIKGLIIGRPYHYDNENYKQFKKIIKGYLKNKKCPILYNTNIGHTDPIITLRYGSVVELDSEINLFKFIS